MSNEHAHESSVATYVIVALILGVITYIEFAIVEFEIAWLSNSWILFWLALLSVVKFALVIMFFMYLKDDDNLYSGFFASGMVFALGTFVVLAFLFTLPATFRFVQAQSSAAEVTAEVTDEHAADDAHGGEAGLSEQVRRLIQTDGRSRPLVQRLDTPAPKNLALTLQAPTISEQPSYTLSAAPALFTTAAAEPADDTPADETAQQASQDMAAASWNEELGSETYSSNCASCHQGNGQGIPGAFPPLAGGHMPNLYNAEGGRDYLVNVLLYGLQGEITVAGQTYNGQMPAWSQLSNEQIAAVLNHELTSWDNEAALQDFQPITAEQVEEQRGQDLSTADVLAQRSEPGTQDPETEEAEEEGAAGEGEEQATEENYEDA
jgi:mono/diheme cytochrome c family protein/heme/copper-type cytochrome/quinol oxidase subunit 4